MSQWINFVKQFAAENDIPYGEALREAKPYYNKLVKGASQGLVRREAKPRQRNDVDYDQMADDLLGYGGAEAQKGALAALLSGLDAQIKIN